MTRCTTDVEKLFKLFSPNPEVSWLLSQFSSIYKGAVTLSVLQGEIVVSSLMDSERIQQIFGFIRILRENGNEAGGEICGLPRISRWLVIFCAHTYK
jgi:hypothetical protein